MICKSLEHLGSHIILRAIKSAYKYITADKRTETAIERIIPVTRYFFLLFLASAISFDIAV